MNKNFKFYVITWAILLAIFNVVVFVTPNEAAGMTKFGGAFIAGYAFVTLAFIGQLVCALFAFREREARRLFLNLPLITISYSAAIATAVVGSVCMIIPNLPNWVAIIVCFAILAFNAVSVVRAKAAAELVGARDDITAARTFYIKSLTADAESLIARSRCDEVRTQAQRVRDALRYSDPMSVDALSGIEEQMTLRLSELGAAVANDDPTAAQAAADALEILANDRNKRSKLYK